MNEVAVLDNLIEGNRAPLSVRRALACLSKYHSGALRRIFSQRVLHLSDADRSWDNYAFVRDRLKRAADQLELDRASPTEYPHLKEWSEWQRQLPTIQVEGEEILGPELRTDEYHWCSSRINWPMPLVNVQRTTLYFLSRALAELEIAGGSFLCRRLVVNFGELQNGLASIHRLIQRFGPHAQESFEFMSGFAEVYARRVSGPIQKFNNRLLNDEAVPNIARRICETENLRLLDLSGSDPWYYRSMCLSDHLFAKTAHVFATLTTLRLDGITMAQPGSFRGLAWLGDALKEGRLPKLQVLSMSKVVLDDSNAWVLSSGLARVCHTLVELNVSFNRIGWDGLKAILRALEGSHTLMHLALRGNGLSPSDYEELAQALKCKALPKIRHVDADFADASFHRAQRALMYAIQSARAAHDWARFIRREAEEGTPFEPLKWRPMA